MNGGFANSSFEMPALKTATYVDGPVNDPTVPSKSNSRFTKEVIKGESALHAILLLYMEGSYSTSRFLFLGTINNFLSKICTVHAKTIQRYYYPCSNSPYMHDRQNGSHSRSIRQWSDSK